MCKPIFVRLFFQLLKLLLTEIGICFNVFTVDTLVYIDELDSYCTYSFSHQHKNYKLQQIVSSHGFEKYECS